MTVEQLTNISNHLVDIRWLIVFCLFVLVFIFGAIVTKEKTK